MKITINRSEEYVRNLAAKTGQNFPESVEMDLAPSDLSYEARKLLADIISPAAVWPEKIDSIGYSQDYSKRVNYGGWGREPFFADITDVDRESIAIISAVIVQAFQKIDAMYAAVVAKQQAKVDAAAAVVAAEAALRAAKERLAAL